MRARSIKPGFFKNEVLASLGPYARLLFSGLWLLADRTGRLEDRPPRIKAELFPYEARTNVVLMLKRLCEAGFIQRYTINGCKYIQIVNFLKHQNPHIHESDSTIPAPCTAPDEHSTSTVLARLTPDSLFSDPKPVFTTHTGLDLEHCTDQPNSKPRVCVSDLPGQTSQQFEEFWKVYPHRVGKNAACQAWISIVTIENEAEVFAGLNRWLLSAQWKRGVYSRPDRWIMDKQWQDHPAAAVSEKGSLDWIDEGIAERDQRRKELGDPTHG
jgi:hypothetical protein